MPLEGDVMFSIRRSAWWGAFAATFAVALFAGSAGPLRGQEKPAPPTAAQIAPFVGDWLLSVSMGANDSAMASTHGRPEPTVSVPIRSSPCHIATPVLLIRMSVDRRTTGLRSRRHTPRSDHRMRTVQPSKR